MPSTARIALASAVAFVVAGVVLTAFVLPAEYGKDPLGTGKRLGLLDLYEAKAGDAPLPPPAQQTTERPKTYKVDASTMTLGPGMAFEYKYRLEQGASMVYAWRTETPVKYEFHGEPDDSRLKVVSYEKQAGDYAAGSLTAAFTGIHGWYWENTGKQPVTIVIHSSGFFTSADEMRPKFDLEKHKMRTEHIEHPLADPKP
jgi:hypothetical protein